jgi:hypothetical protein
MLRVQARKRKANEEFRGKSIEHPPPSEKTKKRGGTWPDSPGFVKVVKAGKKLLFPDTPSDAIA